MMLAWRFFTSYTARLPSYPPTASRLGDWDAKSTLVTQAGVAALQMGCRALHTDQTATLPGESADSGTEA